MQIDFHHAVTYVAARLAGFPVEKAKIISYSAQYVDDAVNSGTIKFRNKAMYSRISSAHKMLDYRDFEELSNHFTWIPFHFLPGNGGKESGMNPDGGFVQKLICKPDSHVANDMVNSCIAGHDRDYGLYRLGITMHVLADTFAHQGFAGINDEINEVKDLKMLDDDADTLLGKITDYFGDMFDTVSNKIVSNAFPLGHGGALTCPDMPFLKWSYTDGEGKAVTRNNTDIFMDAVVRIHEAMVRYQKKAPDYTLEEKDRISQDDLDQIEHNFLSFDDDEEEDRHAKWMASIANGDFSFSEEGQEIFSYIPKGMGSWKHLALDTKKEVETNNERFRFKPEFLGSDWKLFHDALQIHRIDIIRNIFPQYGICAA
jgi:hypothetical protein